MLRCVRSARGVVSSISSNGNWSGEVALAPGVGIVTAVGMGGASKLDMVGSGPGRTDGVWRGPVM